MSSEKTIGVLTSGGDCAGLNAVIRAVVARAVQPYSFADFARPRRPASRQTLLFVAGLADPRFVVEIEAEAVT